MHLIGVLWKVPERETLSLPGSPGSHTGDLAGTDPLASAVLPGECQSP